MPFDETTISASRFPAPAPRPSRTNEIDDRLAKAEQAIAGLGARLSGMPSGAQLLIWGAAMIIGGVLFGFFAALLLRVSI